MSKGFTGISFPFRLGNRGGIKLSTTSMTDFSHIEESIMQILNTAVGERVMELYFGSDLSSYIFEPGDTSAESLIKYEVVQCLKAYEPRIEVREEDITLEELTNEESGANLILITLKYRVIQYSVDKVFSVEVGGR